ncbi:MULTISPECIES: aspartate 1-decarboxylase [Allobacillus]|uniref:Aspartate 1-decarboxylase n=1 Tax=Allobacillus salarius TaxID=1955272 RepID=A0A556PT24_9BACI|nr:aspartate 1-decarboxylase [Allobacillus salarius]TSJ67543.1 aspartate 1-decarboxylase [Allobacillus salarius]
MIRTMMNAKIHRATVTEANLNYVGSITIDSTLLKKVGILPHEKVQIVNNNNGERIETYVISGEPDSGVICLNGAAARKFQPGDQIIIISYVQIDEKELGEHRPSIAILNEKNQIEQQLEEEPPLTIL